MVTQNSKTLPNKTINYCCKNTLQMIIGYTKDDYLGFLMQHFLIITNIFIIINSDFLHKIVTQVPERIIFLLQNGTLTELFAEPKRNRTFEIHICIYDRILSKRGSYAKSSFYES